jgi:hypothetical protein
VSSIVLRNEIGNSYQIAGDESRKLDAHYSVIVRHFFSRRENTSFGATPGATSLIACLYTRRSSFSPRWCRFRLLRPLQQRIADHLAA